MENLENKDFGVLDKDVEFVLLKGSEEISDKKATFDAEIEEINNIASSSNRSQRATINRMLKGLSPIDTSAKKLVDKYEKDINKINDKIIELNNKRVELSIKMISDASDLLDKKSKLLSSIRLFLNID